MKISIFIHAAILSRIKERIEQYLNMVSTLFINLLF